MLLFPYTLLWPEIALVGAFLLELLLLALPQRNKWGGWVTLAATIFSLLGVLARANIGGSGVSIPFLQVGIYTWQTPFIAVANIAAISSLLWVRLAKKPEPYETGPISFFILAALLGAQMLVLAKGPILSVLALETLSLASYAGVAWPGKKPALEAALRYALLGIFSTACLIFGLSWAYGLDHLPHSQYSENAWWAVRGLVLIGVLFKLGAFPLHGWVLKVYEEGPLPFIAFLSVAPKVAALGWLSNLAGFTQGSLNNFSFVLALLGAASVLAGNIGAFFQNRFLRLMGFSSVAHAGFMLLCLACPSPLEVAGFYSLALLGINYMAMGLWGQLQKMGAHAEVSSVNGWAQNRFWLAGLAVLSGLALAGLPPTVGFTAKFKLVLGLIGQATVFGKDWAYGLAAFTALNTAISLYYYLRLPYHLIFPKQTTAPTRHITSAAQWSLMALGLALLFFFFAAQILDDLVGV